MFLLLLNFTVVIHQLFNLLLNCICSLTFNKSWTFQLIKDLHFLALPPVRTNGGRYAQYIYSRHNVGHTRQWWTGPPAPPLGGRGPVVTRRGMSHSHTFMLSLHSGLKTENFKINYYKQLLIYIFFVFIWIFSNQLSDNFCLFIHNKSLTYF